MGSQQLLLVLVGILTILAAVAFGTNLFISNMTEKNRDNVISDCINLGSNAQQYYMKPTSLGGGSRSFNGWWAKLDSSLKGNQNGKFLAVENIDQVKLTAFGVETGNDQLNPVKVLFVIKPDSMQTFILN